MIIVSVFKCIMSFVVFVDILIRLFRLARRRKISNYLTKTTGNVTTNPPGGHGMADFFSVGCVEHVTMSIPFRWWTVSKVSASRLSDAHSSALLRAAGLECYIIANVTAIASPVSQTVFTKIPFIWWHGCHQHDRNQQENWQNRLHPNFYFKMNQIVLIIYYRINCINTKLWLRFLYLLPCTRLYANLCNS